MAFKSNAERSLPPPASSTQYPPEISTSDHILSSRIVLPFNASIYHSQFTPSSSTVPHPHDALELARRLILRRNDSAPLLKSILCNVHIDAKPVLYAFIISTTEDDTKPTSALRDLHFEGLTATEPCSFKPQDLYPCSNACALRPKACSNCLAQYKPPPPGSLHLPTAANILPRQSLRNVYHHFISAVRTRLLDDITVASTKRPSHQGQKRQVLRFKDGFLLGLSTSSNEWGTEWRPRTLIKPLIYCHPQITLTAPPHGTPSSLLIHPQLLSTPFLPLTSTLPLPAGTPITLLPYGTPAYFLTNYVGPTSALSRQFQESLAGLGACPNDCIKNDAKSPQNCKQELYIIAWINVENKQGEDKGITIIYPTRLCLSFIPTSQHRQQMDYIPELPVPLQPSPQLPAGIVSSSSDYLATSPVDSDLKPYLVDDDVPPRAVIPASPTSDSLRAFRTLTLHKSKDVRRVASEVGDYVDAVARERDRERERLKREREGGVGASPRLARMTQATSTLVTPPIATNASGPVPPIPVAPPPLPIPTVGVVTQQQLPQIPPPSQNFYPSPPQINTGVSITQALQTSPVEDVTPLPVAELTAMITDESTPVAITPSSAEQPPASSATFPAPPQSGGYDPFGNIDQGWSQNSQPYMGMAMDMDFPMDMNMGFNMNMDHMSSGNAGAGGYSDHRTNTMDFEEFTDDDFSFFDGPVRAQVSISNAVMTSGHAPIVGSGLRSVSGMSGIGGSSSGSGLTPAAGPAPLGMNLGMSPPLFGDLHGLSGSGPPSNPADLLQRPSPWSHSALGEAFTPRQVNSGINDSSSSLVPPELLPPSPGATPNTHSIPTTPNVFILTEHPEHPHTGSPGNVNGKSDSGGHFAPIQFSPYHRAADGKYAFGKFALPSPPDEEDRTESLASAFMDQQRSGGRRRYAFGVTSHSLRPLPPATLPRPPPLPPPPPPLSLSSFSSLPSLSSSSSLLSLSLTAIAAGGTSPSPVSNRSGWKIKYEAATDPRIGVVKKLIGVKRKWEVEQGIGGRMRSLKSWVDGGLPSWVREYEDWGRVSNGATVRTSQGKKRRGRRKLMKSKIGMKYEDDVDDDDDAGGGHTMGVSTAHRGFVGNHESEDDGDEEMGDDDDDGGGEGVENEDDEDISDLSDDTDDEIDAENGPSSTTPAPSRPTTPPPAYLPLGPTLLHAHFFHSYLLPLSKPLRPPGAAVAPTNIIAAPPPVSVPTPVSPAATMGAASEKSKSLEAAAFTVAKEVVENSLWGEAWRAHGAVGGSSGGSTLSSVAVKSSGSAMGSPGQGVGMVAKVWFADVKAVARVLEAVPGLESSFDLATLYGANGERGGLTLVPLEAPMMSIGKGDAVINVLPTALRFWEKLGLGPRGGQKDATAFVLFEDDGDQRQQQVEAWLGSVQAAYSTKHMGTLTPGTSTMCTKNGLVPLRLDSSFRKSLTSFMSSSATTPTTTIIFVVTPTSTLTLASPTLRQIFSAIKKILKIRTSPTTPSQFIFHLVPEHSILGSISNPSTRDYDLETLCHSIYNRIPIHMSRPLTGPRTLSSLTAAFTSLASPSSAAAAISSSSTAVAPSGSGTGTIAPAATTGPTLSPLPIDERANRSRSVYLEEPAFTLARPVQPKVSYTYAKGARAPLGVLDRWTFLHVGYEVSRCGKWIICACVDERGEAHEVGVWLTRTSGECSGMRDGDGGGGGGGGGTSHGGQGDGEGDAASGAKGDGSEGDEGSGEQEKGDEAYVVKKVWEFAVGFAKRASVEWRIVVSRLGAMTEGEIQAWMKHLTSNILTTPDPRLAHVTLLCVDLHNSWTFLTSHPRTSSPSSGTVPSSSSQSTSNVKAPSRSSSSSSLAHTHATSPTSKHHLHSPQVFTDLSHTTYAMFPRTSGHGGRAILPVALAPSARDISETLDPLGLSQSYIAEPPSSPINAQYEVNTTTSPVAPNKFMVNNEVEVIDLTVDDEDHTNSPTPAVVATATTAMSNGNVLMEASTFLPRSSAYLVHVPSSSTPGAISMTGIHLIWSSAVNTLPTHPSSSSHSTGPHGIDMSAADSAIQRLHQEVTKNFHELAVLASSSRWRFSLASTGMSPFSSSNLGMGYAGSSASDVASGTTFSTGGGGGGNGGSFSGGNGSAGGGCALPVHLAAVEVMRAALERDILAGNGGNTEQRGNSGRRWGGDGDG